jgi:hypothetical protein
MYKYLGKLLDSGNNNSTIFDNSNKKNEFLLPLDLKLVFVTQPDGEKLIKIHLYHKNLIFLNDFIMDLVSFFRTPFNGSDDIENKYFFRAPDYNNYPPMVIKILA